MARALRIEFPGAIYHVTSRGNERKAIFRNVSDRKTFLEILAQVKERFDWECHAYVLMENHYHLLIETPKGNLSRGMKPLNSLYAQKFNFRYKRTGHLFQGRYKAFLIEKECYLLELSRYIVLNPVRAGLVENPDEYKWSSFRATIGKELKPKFLSIDWLLSQFGTDKVQSIIEYQKYVQDGMGEKFPHDKVVGQLVLGGENFLKEINLHESKRELDKLKEVRREERHAATPSLERIFQQEMRKGKRREEIVYLCYQTYDFTMKEIADFLGLHYTSISLDVKKWEKELRKRK